MSRGATVRQSGGGEIRGRGTFGQAGGKLGRGPLFRVFAIAYTGDPDHGECE